MAAITRIDARIRTSTLPGSGTDANVYLAIGGREFSIDSQGDFDDFENPGNANNPGKTYTFGLGANVAHADTNSPTSPQLDTADLDRFPVWIRMEPKNDSGSDWSLEEVEVVVNPGGGQIRFVALVGNGKKLWLGQHHGKFCFLKRA